MDYMDQQAIAKIEGALTQRLIDHFKIDRQTLLFDATNFDTFIDTRTNSDLAPRGKAESKRKDLRIVGLALLVSTDFHAPEGQYRRGRLRAEYVLTERSSLQERLSRVFEVDKLAHP